MVPTPRQISTTRQQREWSLTPLGAAAIYLFVGAFWILLSDNLLAWLVEDPRLLTQLQTYKGWLFVGVTGALLYVLVRWSVAAIHRSEARFRAIFDGSALGVVVVDLDGLVVESNPALERMLGYTQLELDGVDFAELAHPDGEDVGPSGLSSLLAGERDSYQTERRSARKDGSTVWLRLTISLVRDGSNRPEFAVVMVEDVSESRRAAEELTFERDRLRAVVESIADPLFVCDARGTITLANPAGLALVGEPGDDAPLTLADFLTTLKLRYPDGRSIPLEELAITRALGGATERGREEVGVRPGTQERIHLLISAAPLRDEAGRVVGAVEVAADTTRVHALSDLAQRRAAQLQAILDNMVDSVFVCDVNGRVTLTNAGATRLFGLASFAEIGSLPAEFPARFHLRHPDGTTIQSGETATARALLGETVVEIDQLLSRSEEEGDRYIRVSSAPIRDDEGTVVAAVTLVRDVTELTELDRMKDEFTSVAAHELKTPVTIMKGYAEVLLRTVGETAPPPRRILEAIDRGADRIEGIVRDLLDVSQLHLGQVRLSLERVDLCELCSEVATRLAGASLQRQVRVVCAEPVFVLGDSDRLSRVLETLVDNALRYSPAGGDVDVVVALQDDEAVVSVRDQGVGIPKAKQARLFERFYRAHTGTPYDYGGMGVGLFISREIVRRHGGRVWFESQEGRGSTFSFSLPLDGQHTSLGNGGAVDG